MKSYLLLLLFPLVFISCNENSSSDLPPDPNPLETALYNCLKEQYAAKSVDVDDMVKNLEELAIKTGNLKDGSAQAYYDMFSKSAAKDHFPFSQEQAFFRELKNIPFFPLDLACNRQIAMPDSIILNSKLSIYNKYLGQELTEKRAKRLQPNAAKPVIQTYKPEDFENDYIKLFTLSSIAHRTSIENPIYRK